MRRVSAGTLPKPSSARSPAAPRGRPAFRLVTVRMRLHAQKKYGGPKAVRDTASGLHTLGRGWWQASAVQSPCPDGDDREPGGLIMPGQR